MTIADVEFAEVAASRYYESALRPQLLNGCPRIWYIMVTLAAILIPFLWQTLWSIALAVIFWNGSVRLMRRIVKHDPRAIELYLRQVRFWTPRHFEAHSKPGARPVAFPSRWVSCS